MSVPRITTIWVRAPLMPKSSSLIRTSAPSPSKVMPSERAASTCPGGTAWMPEPCQSCAFKEVDFGGCRCQAFALTGDAGNTAAARELGLKLGKQLVARGAGAILAEISQSGAAR